MNLEEIDLQIKSSSEKFRRLQSVKYFFTALFTVFFLKGSIIRRQPRRKTNCRTHSLQRHLPPLQPPAAFTNRRTLAIIRTLFGSTKQEFLIEQPFYCDYGYNIHIGENFYCNVNCVILDAAPVTFGNNVFIAPNCGFYTAGHPFDVNLRNQGLEYAKPITIGNNVWIGAQVCVLPGVTIGDNCVIGAGSVVTKNIPDNSLAVGNPCRVIRTLNE